MSDSENVGDGFNVSAVLKLSGLEHDRKMKFIMCTHLTHINLY